MQRWEFCNIPREPHRASSIMPSRRVLWTNVKGELGKFSLIGKHLLGEKNFPFDIGSKRNNWERSTLHTELNENSFCHPNDEYSPIFFVMEALRS
jgi:hypothetical protein